jgi:2-dehydro-3-deoxygalactonokinase
MAEGPNEMSSYDNHYIAVDWGTSRMKAYLCEFNDDLCVTILDEVTCAGVQKKRGEFAQTFLRATAEWRLKYGALSVLMAGQIASSIGWRESPYVACPVAPADIIEASISFSCEQHDIFMLPGLSCQLANGHFDVMRSEDVQVLGWLQAEPSHRQGRYLICLPGTHTKWVLVNNGIIEVFKTAMTGELYDLLSTSSVLIQSAAVDFDQNCFDEGAQYTISSVSGSLIHGLFSVRTKQLFEGMDANQASSYLSGLLIGSDVRAAVNAQEWDISVLNGIVVVGEDHISRLFQQILQSQIAQVSLYAGKLASVQGFAAIRQRQLVSQVF